MSKTTISVSGGAMPPKIDHTDRRHFIGGSDARVIMGKDEKALLRLWKEKRGEVAAPDLSNVLVVQLGLVTEDLNRRWYELNSGHRIGDIQRVNALAALSLRSHQQAVPSSIGELHIAALRRAIDEELVLGIVIVICEVDEVCVDALRDISKFLNARRYIKRMQHAVVRADIENRRTRSGGSLEGEVRRRLNALTRRADIRRVAVDNIAQDMRTIAELASGRARNFLGFNSTKVLQHILAVGIG